MSDVFALDQAGRRELEEQARLNPLDLSQVEPTTFEGTGRGIGLGIMRGGARVGQFIGMAAAAPVALYEYATDQEGRYLDPYFKAIDEYANNAVDFWTPAQGDVGKAGQVLGGLGEIALPLMAGAGNPTLLIGSQEFGTATDLSRQGVDAATAVQTALLQGSATAVGFKIPFLGGTLGTRMTSGAGGNLIINAATAKGTRELLEAHGYVDQAAAFDPLDPTARFVDVLTGLAFGAIAHGTAPRLTPVQVAAIATAADAKHMQSDTAPGIPADLKSAVAHQAAMEQAVEALVAGDPVTAPADVLDASYVKRARDPAPDLPTELTDLDPRPPLPVELQNIPEYPNLKPEQRAVEQKFRAEILADVDAAIARYEKMPEAKGGKVLNTDLARELSADYRANRALSAAVHEPASALVKAMYARRLQQAPKQGEEPLVLFTAGGTGAGKSSGLKLQPGVIDRAQIVYDTNMGSLTSAVEKIEQALAAGKRVQIMYVFRDPIEALENGALPRAMRMEAEDGSGRTVPIDEHLDTHFGSNEVAHVLAARYGNNQAVELFYVDNSLGRGKAKLAQLGELPRADRRAYNDTREQAVAAIEKARGEGRASEAIAAGFLDSAPATRARAGDRSGVPGQPEPGVARGETGKLTPKPPGDAGGIPPEDVFAVQAAREAALDPALLVPTDVLDADGVPVAVTAAELLARADQELAAAQKDARGFEAAIDCFLRTGSG
jgi:hypothetical protein